MSWAWFCIGAKWAMGTKRFNAVCLCRDCCFSEGRAWETLSVLSSHGHLSWQPAAAGSQQRNEQIVMPPLMLEDCLSAFVVLVPWSTSVFSFPGHRVQPLRHFVKGCRARKLPRVVIVFTRWQAATYSLRVPRRTSSSVGYRSGPGRP